MFMFVTGSSPGGREWTMLITTIYKPLRLQIIPDSGDP